LIVNSSPGFELGDSGFGKFIGFVGAVLSIAGFPWIGIPLMIGGGIMTQKALKKEAMEKMKSAMQGMRANTRTTERAIPVIYGRQRVGGNILWMSTEGKGPGDNNPPRNKLFAIYGISEGPIDGFEEMYFNDIKVWDARSGNLSTQFRNAFHFENRLGTNSQAPFTYIADSHNLWDVASETYPLVAAAAVHFNYSQDIYQAVPTVTWTIRGKLIPDWSNVDSLGIPTWYQSGPFEVADLLTNKQHGMGISSGDLSIPDVRSSHAYATAPISPNSREIIEIVDTSLQRPKYFNKTVDIPSVELYTIGIDEGASWWYTSSPATEFSLEKFPIKPGSMTLTSMLGSVYYDSPRSGMISEFGRILGAAAAQVGSINYRTGNCWFDKPTYYQSAPDQNVIYVHQMTAKWYADWEFSQRTKYQNIARSLYIVSTPETLVESAYAAPIATLYSSHGGGGTADYSTGEINAYFGAHEWYDNNPIEIHYRVNTRARFSTNYPLWDATKVMDAIRDVQQHYRGFLVYANGKYAIKVDKAEGSVYSFDDDNIVAGTFKISQPSVRDVPTKVLVKYIDAINNYTPPDVPFDVRSVDAGQESEHVLEMPGITFRDEANAIAYSYANLASLVNAISFETNYNALGLEAGDVVDVTHPAAAWNQKLFRILSMEYARNDKLAIAAIEHDPSAYVDDWLQGPMISRNPSFFPARSFWPPNVTSATLSEYSRTLSDGTVVPTIKYAIMAVDSPNLHVAKWNIYAMNATRGQVRQLAYSGVNTTGYIYPVEPGVYGISIYGVSDFGNESARAWVASLATVGTPEHEWQSWRIERIESDRSAREMGTICDGEVTLSNGIRFYGWRSSSYQVAVGVLRGFGALVAAEVVVGSLSGGMNAISMIPSSGGCATVFWRSISGTYGAIVTASLTIIKSSTLVFSPAFSFYCAAANSAGQAYAFGTYPSGLERIGWMPVSLNLNAPNVSNVNSVGTFPSFSDYSYNLSATFTNSMGVLAAIGAVSKIPSGFELLGYKWTFKHDISSYHSTGSAGTSYGKADYFIVRSEWQTVTQFRAQIGGYYAARCWLAMDVWDDITMPVFGFGKHLMPFDAREASGNTVRQVYTSRDDMAYAGGTWVGLKMRRPFVTEDRVVYIMPIATAANTVVLDSDVYRYWRVLSATPLDYMTFI